MPSQLMCFCLPLLQRVKQLSNILSTLSLQGIKKLKNQPMVGFNGRTDGLQLNVGFGGLQDKVPLS